jgi:hypothetical protein
MSNKIQNTDEFLDELFNMAINAKKVAVETVTGGDDADFIDRQEILDKSNELLNRYRTEFKQAISERIAAERLEAVSGLSTTKLIVDLSLAQVEILKLKANDHDWSVYVPDDTKLALEKTLASIEDQLAALTPQVSEGEKT